MANRQRNTFCAGNCGTFLHIKKDASRIYVVNGKYYCPFCVARLPKYIMKKCKQCYYYCTDENGVSFCDYDDENKPVNCLDDACKNYESWMAGKALAEQNKLLGGVGKRKRRKINVAELRESLQISQEEFAFSMGVSTQTVAEWESGKTEPSPTALNLLFLIQQDHSIVLKLQAE